VRFTARTPLGGDVFPNSLAVHSGAPEAITIEFDPAVAPFVRERE
jgi:hypothetical protein